MTIRGKSVLSTAMKLWRNLEQMPKPIWVLFFSTLVNRLGSMALPFLALYLTKGAGFSVAEAGVGTRHLWSCCLSRGASCRPFLGPLGRGEGHGNLAPALRSRIALLSLGKESLGGGSAYRFVCAHE